MGRSGGFARMGMGKAGFVLGAALACALGAPRARAGEEAPPATGAWFQSAEGEKGEKTDDQPIAAPEDNPPSPQVSRQIESVTLDLGDGAAMTLNRMPAGRFVMGSPPKERGRADDEIQCEVTISKPFYLGIYPVTQGQYLAVTGMNPSKFVDFDNPVEFVSWNDAMMFCKKLSEKTGRKARLPTEAEWEYACRAGATTAYNTGDALAPDQANFNESGKNQTTAVGSYPANALGLFDMHGNVWEWCSDRYGNYPKGDMTDPKGSGRGLSHVLRGGSWISDAVSCRSADRFRNAAGLRSGTVGFRVALD